MSPLQVLSGPPHECVRDGHLIALRCRWDLDTVAVVPFCEACRMVFLPSSSMAGRAAEWLMKQVEAAQRAPAAPPEAHEGLYE